MSVSIFFPNNQKLKNVENHILIFLILNTPDDWKPLHWRANDVKCLHYLRGQNLDKQTKNNL